MLGHLEDTEILGLIVQQRRDALEELYNRYGAAVFSLSVHMLRDSGPAEEVTQDTFLNVWRRASSYSSKRGTVRAWLFSIAHHRTVDEIRRRKRRQEKIQPDVDLSNRLAAESGDPVKYAAAEFERQEVKGALSALRPEQRKVVELAYYGGFTHSEISKLLDQPLGTVKTRMRLGLKKLREIMAGGAQEWADHGL